jgi:hypothetical protein
MPAKRIFRCASLAISALLLCVVSVNADSSKNTPVILESGVKQVLLLELYTSEGCSSCPPAEEWLNDLKRNQGLWSKIVPVSFHVDYWNNLGWPDAYSLPEYTARQRAYAAAWNSPSVYTPEFVLNGREWHLSNDELSLSGKVVGNLRASITESGGSRKVEINFQPSGHLSGPLLVEAALLADEVKTQVKRGENEGRLLEHDFLCVELLKSPMESTGSEQYRAALSFPTQTKAPRAAIAIWVRSPQSLTPIQSVGGWLQENAKQ